MVNEWNLRAEVLAATHRWPVVMLFILVGSLIGVAIAYLLPSPYRAETSLLVAYNADVHARNLDDYKNWQMEQLNVFILSDEVLQETLARLKAQNSAWVATSLDDLEKKLSVYWRNAGEWRLVAEASSPEMARELIQTWEQVNLEQIGAANVHAKAVLELSTNLDNLSNTRLDLKLRATELEQIRQALQSRMQAFDGSISDQPLDPLERSYLLSRVSSVAGWHPAGSALLEMTPPTEAPASEYIPWLERALIHIDQELESLGPQTDQLSTEYDQLYDRWSEELEASRGLTAYMLIEPLGMDQDQTRPARSTSLMAFVGGLIGLLVWALFWLVRPVMVSKAQTS